MSRGKTGFLIVGAVACIVVGAGLERVRQAVLAPIPETPLLPERAQSVQRSPSRAGAESDDEKVRAALNALQKKVADLQKSLEARDAELAALKQGKAADANARKMPGRDEFRQRMEQLKKEHPDQYAEMEKRRDEFRQRVEQEKQAKADFLSSVGTQAMTEAQKANHEKLLETLAKIDALRAQQEQSRGEPGSETDQATRQAMGQTMAELGSLYEQEREYLLQQAAYAAGYEGSDAASFVDYIQTAVQSTSMQGFGGPPGGGGPPPGM